MKKNQYEESLDRVSNENGGGLSVAVTGKYTSVRHERAKISGKLTAGEAAKELRSRGIKVSAKELVEVFRLLNGYDPEWHHAGFYKVDKKSTMGRTFFFTSEQIDEIEERFPEVEGIKVKEEAERKAKEENKIKGFYYSWDYDYNGRNGKKRNYKVLGIYEGSELNAPRNFCSLEDAAFERARTQEGKKYFGWDEPNWRDFE
jgi:hypothetical protein